MRVFLSFLIAVASVIAQTNSIKKGMSFTEARKVLIAQKWQPVNVYKGKRHEYIGIEKVLIKKNFKELESCAIDNPYCIFNYIKEGKCLRIITFGENIKDMKVFDWNNDCPDPIDLLSATDTGK